MKKVFLITQFYPFDNHEEPFILPELNRLKNKFDVTIIAADVEEKSEIKAKVPSGTKVVCYNSEDVKLYRLFYKTIGYKISKTCKEAKGIDEFNKHYYAKGKTFERWFKKNKFVGKSEEFIIYSYWFSWWNIGFAEKKSSYPGMKLITRAHGYDLYDERHREGRQPFRKYLDSKMDEVFFISEKGKKYYLEKHANRPIQDKKYIVSYLGQEDLCGDDIKKSESELFTIVSCSYVIPLKRNELIAKALGELKNDRPVRWIHFGDGMSMDSLKAEVEQALSKNSNLSIELRGYVPNEGVIDFYQSEGADVFITTSSTEGLPVSISEALCFGVPIIATDVGGICEQVEDNGILLNSNPTVEDVKKSIEEMLQKDPVSLHRMGQSSRDIWKRKFDINHNVDTFIEAIEKREI